MKQSSLSAAVIGFLLASASLSSAAINFQFTYTGTSGFMDSSQGNARQAALQNAADQLAAYFTTSTNVTLTFEVESESTNSGTLASAGSPTYYNPAVAGFYRTVAQKKAITGVDDSGASYDGDVSWNWFHSWSVGPTVPPGQFDMNSVAKHELLHALGFFSWIADPSAGTNAARTVWSIFDSFLVTSTGTPLISSAGVWQGLDAALTNGGLFFSGANAVAANGGNLVPIYSPASWEEGSSGSHVSSSAGIMIMNASVASGPATQTLNGIELGILRDIGYSVVPEPGSALLFSGAAITLIFRRRNQRSA